MTTWPQHTRHVAILISIMAKSLRSKRARRFRAIKRTKNEAVEQRRLATVTAKLGTLPADRLRELEADKPPERFVHRAPNVRSRLPPATSMAVADSTTQDPSAPTLDLGEQSYRRRQRLAAEAAAAATGMDVAAASPPTPAAPMDTHTEAAVDDDKEGDEDEDDEDDAVMRVYHTQTGQFKRVKHAKAAARKAEGGTGNKRKRRQRSLDQRVFL
jgi:hypothetical protein